VNAWPLDEGLIDYVAASYGAESEENPGYRANVVASPSFTFSGETIDASSITKELLADTLHELGGVEANVATGYHAIEFLLWGQDLNGTGPGAGARPASDFDPANCSWGNCDRRAAYLQTATDLLIDELEWITAQWAPGGEAREGLVGGDVTRGLATIFTGMGSLSYGELAGERMQLGLLLHDPEEEHDCFSDNTHASHYYDALGIRNVYLGEYERIDGSVVQGPSVSDLVAAASADVDAALRERLDATMAAMAEIVSAAEGGEAYDQQIGEGNPVGNARVQAAIDALRERPRALTGAVAQDPRHCRGRVVVKHRKRNPAEEGKGADMAVQERLRRLPRIGLHEPQVAMRQDQAEEGDLLAPAPDLDDRLAEVDLGMARRMMKRNEGLARRLPLRPNVVLHDPDCVKTLGGGGFRPTHGDVRIRHETHSWH